MPVRVRHMPGTNPFVRVFVKAALARYRRLHPVAHDLRVLVGPWESIWCSVQQSHAAGVFYRKPGEPLRIVIAAALADKWEKAGETRKDAVLGVIHNLFHELAHYEQHRDGRKLTERGVAVRAWSLMRKLGIE